MSALLLAALGVGAQFAGAVHSDGLFEVDGDVADASGAPLPDDWATVYAGTAGGLDSVFITDGWNGKLPDGTATAPPNKGDDIYDAGGSQNGNDLPSWKWKCGKPSSKSDIEHAYASSYIKDGELYLYFGADRLDPTGGTTQIGFWFLQNGGAPTPATACPDGSGTFTGQHVDGDLFVFSEFQGGGGDSKVSIYEWRNGQLNLLFDKAASSFCNAASGPFPADTVCAKTNTDTIPTQWSYVDNQGTAPNNILAGGFMEGGINLSDLYGSLPRELPCINRFTATTGSSFPDTGVLEDFAGGSFDVCSKIVVDKSTVPSGDPTKFSFSVTGPNDFSASPSLADADTPYAASSVKPGAYTIVEQSVPAGWSLASVVCTDQAGKPVAYVNDQVSVGPGQTVACVFTNARQPQLRVDKVVVGGTAGDLFDLKIDGVTEANDVGNGGTTGFKTVSVGAHTVSETLANGNAVPSDKWAVTVGGACDANGGVTLATGDSKTCTITNTRRTGTVTVVKQYVGTPTAVELFVGAKTAAATQSGDSVTSDPLPTGTTVGVGETTVPAGYTATILCTGDIVAAPYTGARQVTVVESGVTCTVTNTRDQGSIELKKAWAGSPTSVTLDVGSSAGGSQVATTTLSANGTTGAQSVGTGTYYVSETVTDASLFTSSLACLRNGQTVTPGTDNSLVVGKGDTVVCTFTNTRKTVTITTVKDFVGTPAAISIAAGGASKAIIGDDQVSTSVEAGTTQTFSETLTDPQKALYDTSVQCTGDQAAQAGVYAREIAVGTTPVTCTFTNTRKTSAIKIVKDFQGDGTHKTVSLKLDGTTKATDDVDFDTGSLSVDTGSYAVSEAFAAPADAALYTSSYACVAGGQQTVAEGSGIGPVQVSVGDDESVVCTFTNVRKESAIEVDKTVKPAGSDALATDSATLPEPGGPFTFVVKVTNPASNADAMTITGLDDSVYGDVTKAAPTNAKVTSTTCASVVGTVLTPGQSITCTFTASFKTLEGVLVGNAGDSETDTVTVTASDQSGRSRQDTDTAVVTLTDVPSTLEIVKTANPTSIQEPGGNATFTLVIRNPLQFVKDGITVTSVDSITLSTLVDSKFGDITAECGIAGVVLDPGESKTCQIVRTVSGNASTPHVNVATVTGVDDDENTLTASDDATVSFTPVPPPPYEPKIDVAAQKTATPQVQLDAATNAATITYGLSFVNNGPDAATNVVASDTAPSGVTFLAVAQQPSQGSCSVTGGGAALSCSLGTLQPGQSVAAAVTARVASTGTFTNVVTVAGQGGPDTNPANNTAQAATLVIAPLRPPTPAPKPVAKPAPKPKPVVKPAPKPKPVAKPKPKPKPAEICSTLSVAQKSLQGNGKPQLIVATVKEGRKAVKGARVLITGPGIRVTAITGANGTVRLTVRPKKVGILKLEIRNKKACNTQRIGVVAVFEPPVTG